MRTGNPDLSAFRDKGKKLFSWHGTADAIIGIENSVRYRKHVEAVLGGNDRVNEFFRLFEAPGAAHCSPGTGVFPVCALDSLIEWVKQDQTPETLHAAILGPDGEMRQRILCPWSLVARFVGTNSSDAASYSCESSYDVSIEAA
ncbi:Tannase/feruloyl esterase [Aspergillus granulosus]|uniref:Carboxylic ester hydrolase n=1 Tax=Aspergillus granulosus TaxID=176169 RepID=A0ABR4H842_9EURO